jgi:hypothetical protein
MKDVGTTGTLYRLENLPSSDDGQPMRIPQRLNQNCGCVEGAMCSGVQTTQCKLYWELLYLDVGMDMPSSTSRFNSVRPASGSGKYCKEQGSCTERRCCWTIKSVKITISSVIR